MIPNQIILQQVQEIVQSIDEVHNVVQCDVCQERRVIKTYCCHRVF